MTEREKRLESLCSEVWGVMIAANLTAKVLDPQILSAVAHVDRRLREEGLMPTPAKFKAPSEVQG